MPGIKGVQRDICLCCPKLLDKPGCVFGSTPFVMTTCQNDDRLSGHFWKYEIGGKWFRTQKNGPGEPIWHDRQQRLGEYCAAGISNDDNFLLSRKENFRIARQPPFGEVDNLDAVDAAVGPAPEKGVSTAV